VAGYDDVPLAAWAAYDLTTVRQPLNRMVAATRSKAAVNFTFVAGHLQAIWQRHAADRPTVVVDRQSGRMRYRELLAMNFPEQEVAVIRETPAHSAYLIETRDAGTAGERSGGSSGGNSGGAMTVHFQTGAEQQHMPVALASMLAKYNRELLMARFQAYFRKHLPQIAPTAGYGSDAKRFWQEVQPELPRLNIPPRSLRRQA
ncbi:MAG: hypothetical protein AAGL98_00455, partial [Planctomycetota bacterium]